jgi:CRISPR-associated protein Csx10
MKQIIVQLLAESPLTIRADHAPGGAATASYIPGTTFIGALAAVHRMLHSGPEKREEFERLFLHQQIHYPDLYPAIFGDKTLGRNLPVYPLPKTAQSCKRHPGFRFAESEENDAHGVRDSLIDWMLFKVKGSESAEALSALIEHKKCPYCPATMDHLSGYYRRSNSVSVDQLDGYEFYRMDKALESEYTRLQTRTGIDRDSGTVQEGILYNRIVFEEGMRFWGVINVHDEDLLPALTAFLKEVGYHSLVRIGTGRTRGMGKVMFQIREDEREEKGYFADFVARLSAFDQLVHAQNIQDSRYFFALTLHSPLILYDEFLRYRGTIDAQTLLQDILHWGNEDIKLKQIYQAASIRRMTGWQEIWGMPRMNEYAIDAGSVFLFACDVAEGTPEKAMLLRKLFELEMWGVGARRAEGFGRVCVSDQFHRERRML